MLTFVFCAIHIKHKLVDLLLLQDWHALFKHKRFITKNQSFVRLDKIHSHILSTKQMQHYSIHSIVRLEGALSPVFRNNLRLVELIH